MYIKLECKLLVCVFCRHWCW